MPHSKYVPWIWANCGDLNLTGFSQNTGNTDTIGTPPTPINRAPPEHHRNITGTSGHRLDTSETPLKKTTKTQLGAGDSANNVAFGLHLNPSARVLKHDHPSFPVPFGDKGECSLQEFGLAFHRHLHQPKCVKLMLFQSFLQILEGWLFSVVTTFLSFYYMFSHLALGRHLHHARSSTRHAFSSGPTQDQPLSLAGGLCEKIIWHMPKTGWIVVDVWGVKTTCCFARHPHLQPRQPRPYMQHFAGSKWLLLEPTSGIAPSHVDG